MHIFEVAHKYKTYYMGSELKHPTGMWRPVYEHESNIFARTSAVLYSTIAHPFDLPDDSVMISTCATDRSWPTPRM
jgi:hypothetical protein